MVYRIIAKREHETVKSENKSLLIAAAKARVWTSEGWQVVITDGDGTSLDPAGFEKLFAA